LGLFKGSVFGVHSESAKREKRWGHGESNSDLQVSLDVAELVLRTLYSSSFSLEEATFHVIFALANSDLQSQNAHRRKANRSCRATAFATNLAKPSILEPAVMPLYHDPDIKLMQESEFISFLSTGKVL